MPARPLVVLCVHGIGGQERDLRWQADWSELIQGSVSTWSAGRDVDVRFLEYDDLFEKAPLNALRSAAAVAKLLGSGIWHGIGDFFHRDRALAAPSRGLGDLSENMRWTAGMVVQWAESDSLRRKTRDRVLQGMRLHDPDLVLAHSLGSLVCYDTFLRGAGATAIQDRVFLSFGSQIGNPFVRSTFGGRITNIAARRWYHLYNRHDDVFAAKIRLEEASFAQVQTDFDVAGIADHDALQYLGHANTVNRVWREIVGATGARGVDRARIQSLTRADKAVATLAKKPKRRALLVGINEYPDPKDRLEGCVNDVFLMSSLLQENGYSPDDIRVVLDSRATAKGILERLEWLLDGTEDGADRFFYYSGHGAQIPAYGPDDKVDRMDECLVPWDFDWSLEHAVTDDQFSELYSQLPYSARFAAVLDCCHSGGMTREGGARIRGVTPPDDIRHRALRWEPEYQMWVPRDLEIQNKGMTRSKDRKKYAGSTGSKRRFGRSVALRTLPDPEYDRVRKDLDHYGPYLPVLLEACQEDQLAYEYRHGVISHGAFTWSLVKLMRERRAGKRRQPLMSFNALVRDVGKTLAALEYDQTPVVVGPKSVLAKRIPWS
jgi:hypothetical protein